MIVNLVVNARDAMPAGGTLTVRTGHAVVDAHFAAEHRLKGTGEFVTLVVADTGMGMTPEVQARIFQPFFTTKGPTTGTGLGLATVHWIVEQAGGGIVVQSRPGVGTTFTVYLPKVVGAIDAEPARDAAAATVPRPSTVLFVDADESIRMMGARALSERGFTVLTVRQPEEAVALARRDSRTIDLLVTDLAMPGFNGRELADQLRRARPNLRILFTSADMDAAAFQDVQIEHARILQKPYTPESLGRARSVSS